MVGFRKDTIPKIKKAILKKILANATKIEVYANQKLDKSIRDLQVLDSGNLLENSQAKLIVTNTKAIIRFSTIGVPYAKYPYYGLGTSRKYGPRNYLKRAAYLTTKQFGKGAGRLNTDDTKISITKTFSKTISNPSLSNRGFTEVSRKTNKQGNTVIRTVRTRSLRK